MSVYRGFCVEQLRLRCVKLYVLCVCVWFATKFIF